MGQFGIDWHPWPKYSGRFVTRRGKNTLQTQRLVRPGMT
jgi:hypothetical protein